MRYDAKWIIQFAILLLSGMIMFQTLYIQFLDKNIRNKAKFAALEKAVSYPARGAIYDRNGQLIVYNNPVYDIEATYKKIDPKMDTLRFCELRWSEFLF